MFGRDGFASLSEETAQTIERLREQGRTTMAVRSGDRDLGAIGLMDTPRAAVREAIARLKALGIRRMIMISGDNQRVATRSEEHTSELQSLMRISYAVFCLKKKKTYQNKAADLKAVSTYAQYFASTKMNTRYLYKL